jgi:hypothetical protein
MNFTFMHNVPTMMNFTFGGNIVLNLPYQRSKLVALIIIIMHQYRYASIMTLGVSSLLLESLFYQKAYRDW